MIKRILRVLLYCIAGLEIAIVALPSVITHTIVWLTTGKDISENIADFLLGWINNVDENLKPNKQE